MQEAEAAGEVGRLLIREMQHKFVYEHCVSQSVIQRLWQSYLDTKTVARRPKSGCQKSTSAREECCHGEEPLV